MATTKVNTEFIAVNAISGTIIADGAITSTHLAANCVDSSELVTGSIYTIHIAANQVTATKIVTNGVLTRHISDDQVTADKLANSINTDIATGPAALPKAGGTMTGTLNITQASTADTIKLTRSTTAQNNMIKFASDSADKWIVGQRNDSTEHFRFYSYGTSSDVLSILTDGNVGIGTTSPSQKLHIAGAGNQFILINNTSTNDGFFFKAGAGASSIQTNAGSHLMNFFTGGNERLRIDSAGQIGIGGGNYGTDGQVLTSTGASSAPAWEDAAGGPTFKTFGTSSIMIGDDATGTINAADNNTGLGVDIFAALTSGDRNTAIGFNSLNDLTTGSQNSFVGSYSGDAITTGNYNSGVGDGALGNTTEGSNNSGFGRRALFKNTTASNNTAVGYGALEENTTASNNTAVGYLALTANTTGTSNTALGFGALYANVTGGTNTAVGYGALLANTGSYNTAVGAQALNSNTSGEYNIAVGENCLDANTTGSFNVGVGRSALGACTTGTDHVAMGINALGNEVTGIGNTAIGTNAGESANGRYYNVAIGYHAGRYADGTRNIHIGYGANSASNSDWNTLCITTRTASGKGGSTGWIDPNGGGVYQGNNSSSWSTTSDRRIKKNIVNNNIGLEKINQIQVRNFEYRTEEEITDFENAGAAVVTKEGTQIGVIAQEIEEILPEVVKTETTGVKGVNPDNLTWYLINAVKELSAELTAAKARIETLEG